MQELRAAPDVEVGQLPDLELWSAAADLTTNRVALLVSGDLPLACRLVSVEKGGADKADDLIRWSVSDEHIALRQRVGVALIAS